MVSERHAVDASGNQLPKQLGRDPRSAGDVLGVGDNEIDPAFADELRQFLMQNLPPRPPDDVPQA